MLDTLGGIRDMIDRQGIPPRLKILVDQLEKKEGIRIEEPPALGVAEVKEVFQLVDGMNLLGAIVAHLLASIPDDLLPPPEPALEQEIEDEDQVGGLTPEEIDKILDHNLDQLPAALDGWDEATLQQLRAAEVARGEDKARKGALDLIDKALAATS